MSEVRLPKWGVSMTEGTVVQWHKRVVERVEQGEALVDVVTDKVETTLEAPESGTLAEILVEVEETVPVGTPLARIN
jgi:pyruvate/2-oxoglutarate dehydrogenase complex dihydrolipoamide acyltransferase (E2) component